MSVFFDTSQQRELIAAYTKAAQRNRDAFTRIQPLTSSACELLGNPQNNAVIGELEHLASELELDGRDLAVRVDQIMRADARTAYLLSITPNSLLDLSLTQQALDEGWTYAEALLRRELADLLSQPRPLPRVILERIAHIQRELAHLEAPSTLGQHDGDLDWDLGDPRVGVPLRIAHVQATERGRELILRSIEDTASPDQILQDEFEVFFHDNGNLTIVLAGVTDLTDFQLGYNPENNTLRDLDQHAAESFRSTSLEDNEYGRRVLEWAEEMVELGVIEQGTPTTIIGHSFGGDTAFDLAANPHFNGELLNVTHTLSAAYSSQYKFEDIPDHTQAVSIRNIWDAVAFTERQAEFADRSTRDRLAIELAEQGVNGISAVADVKIDETEDDLRTLGIDVQIPPIPELDVTNDQAWIDTPNGLRIDVTGDLSGWGHHQDAYLAYLQDADQPQLLEFFEQLNAEGFTADAVAVSVDVSRPE